MKNIIDILMADVIMTTDQIKRIYRTEMFSVPLTVSVGGTITGLAGYFVDSAINDEMFNSIGLFKGQHYNHGITVSDKLLTLPIYVQRFIVFHEKGHEEDKTFNGILKTIDNTMEMVGTMTKVNTNPRFELYADNYAFDKMGFAEKLLILINFSIPLYRATVKNVKASQNIDKNTLKKIVNVSKQRVINNIKRLFK